MSTTRTLLMEHISKQPLVDTHEHLPMHEHHRERDTDVLREYLTHYFNRDLISAGLSKADFAKAIDAKRPLMERWRLVAPYWHVARYTSYGRALDDTVRGLYDLPRIDEKTIEPLNDQFVKTLMGGQYRRVLKEKCHILTSILDTGDLDIDREYFTHSYRFDSLIAPHTWADYERLQQATGIAVTSFERLLEAVHQALEQVIRSGVRIFKSGLAYERSLSYDRVTRAEAEAEFNSLLNNLHMPEWWMRPFFAGTALQNYLMHHVLDLAQRYEITVQFHTGMQEGNGNILQNSDPLLLSRLFIEYPGVRFDLFHIGFPYYHQSGVLAKTFPNVFLDMCWAHIISASVSVDALYHWMDSVPLNKICAFGGDYLFIDAVYGHQLAARRNVCEALARKVDEGVFDLEEAMEFAEMFLYKNAQKIFRLDIR